MRKIQGYGWKPDLPDVRDYKYAKLNEVTAALLADVDLRSQCPPVLDQSQLGSCTSNSIANCHRFVQQKEGHKNPIQPSRLFIYYNERLIEGTVKEDSGAEIRDGFKTLATQGVCSETALPYNIAKFAKKPSAACYKSALTHVAIQYQRLNNANINELKSCLAAGYPFVYGFTVYESFESDEVAKTGILSMPQSSEQVLGGHAVLCFSGDTRIKLLNGEEFSLKELAETKTNESFWVYSCDSEGNIVPGLAHSPRKTAEAQKLVKVTLDNGEKIRCTPTHPFLLRNGEYKNAEDLSVDDSLMPLYTKISDKELKGYEKLYNPSTNGWQYTHRRIASHMEGGFYDAEVVHHKDFNKLNNSLDNLELMSWLDHTKLHSNNSELLKKYAQSKEGRAKSRELMNKLWADEEWAAKQREKLLIIGENGRKLAHLISSKRDKAKHSESSRNAAIKRDAYKSLQTPEAQAKALKVRNEKFASGVEFREKMRNNAINNFKEYKEKLAAGEIQLTDKQINARKENAKKNFVPEKRQLASFKTAYTRFHSDKYETFEDYMLSKTQEDIPYNHKVVKVEYLSIVEDVYDITVEEHHNFALSSGVFVHNCVGYNDQTQRFITMNSWGADWGQKGYFEIPYSYLTNDDLASDFWTLRLVK